MERGREASVVERSAGRDPLVGRVIHGTYRVIRRLGSGSMGVVHEVEHVRLGKRFALKTLQPEYAERPDVVRRFHREARAAAAIGHVGIVQVTDMGVLESGEPFLVMELLDGHSLRDEMRAVGPLTTLRALDIAVQVCDALAAAHAKGIVHRDLKPDNIFLVKAPAVEERVKVLDFGISKFLEASALLGEPATRTGVLLGTPYYMSPEQLRGAPTIDQRTDVYAMGIVVFEMLAGSVPYKAPSLADLAMAVLTGPQPSVDEHAPGASRQLAGIIRRAMAVDPEVRTPSISRLGLELSEVAAAHRAEDDSRDRQLHGASPRSTDRPTASTTDVEKVPTVPRSPAVPAAASLLAESLPPEGDPTEIADFAFGDLEEPEPETKPAMQLPASRQDDLDDDQPTTILVSSANDLPAMQAVRASAPREPAAPPRREARSAGSSPRAGAGGAAALAADPTTLPLRTPGRYRLAPTLLVVFALTTALTVALTLGLWALVR